MAKKPKLRRFFGETKPKHDELTKWTSAGTLKSGDIWNAYQHLATNYGTAAAPLIPDSWVQSVLAGQIPAGSFSHNIGNISAPSTRKHWNDMAVGEVRSTSEVIFDYASQITTERFLNNFGWEYAFRTEDGSEGIWDALESTYTKTKMGTPAPVVTPDDIEETTELVIGWRTFTVKDYKLRGSWNTWESRVFHASCSCAEFDDPYRMELPAIDERRDLMRQHLAAGTGTCGVYSRKSLKLYKDYRTHPDELRVAAKCVNYGLGYEYDGGYRSEFCRIERLFILMKGDVAAYGETIYSADYLKNLPPISSATLAQILSTTYGVPCDVMSPLEFAYKHDEGML